MFAPQTNPASKRGSYVSIFTTNIYVVCDSRDVYHCPILFSRSTDFSSPLRKKSQALVLGFMSPSSRVGQ